MTDDAEGAWLTTWGREFCAEFAREEEEICGQDAYDVLVEGLGKRATLSTMRNLGKQQIQDLCVAVEDIFESKPIALEQRMRRVIGRVVAHWPEEQ
jgi:hypothetical protein